LEYLEGMPADKVGRGRVDEAKMRSFMAVHAAGSDLLQRTPYIARVQASNLLSHMLRTLEQAEQRKAVVGAIGTKDDNVVVIVGHDANIASVAALLDADWLVSGYQRDDAAPGGALVFELWQESGHQDTLRVYYTVQTPDQMRNTVRLSLEMPPGKAVVFLPRCSKLGEGSPCDWSRFESLAKTVIDDNFVK
jgi:4-phytase/acid phosphatase